MPRFVILEHAGPDDTHWDLLLETGSMLTTWALTQLPDTPGPIEARSLADHRLEYLDYEGPVSGERGSVTRWDAGTYRFVCQSDRELTFSLEGRRLHGSATLTRADDDTRLWRFSLGGQSGQ